MQNKRVLMVVGGLLGLAALCCIGIVIFGYVYDGFSKSDGSAGETHSLVALKAVCNGEAVPETAVYNPDASGHHPSVILQSVGDGEYIFPTGDWGSRPAILERAELVVCLENVVETISETCDYTLEEGAGEVTITRISLVADYRLIATQTAELVAEGTVKAVPRQCNDQETFANNASFTLRGEFNEALEPVVDQYVNVP